MYYHHSKKTKFKVCKRCSKGPKPTRKKSHNGLFCNFCNYGKSSKRRKIISCKIRKKETKALRLNRGRN